MGNWREKIGIDRCIVNDVVGKCYLLRVLSLHLTQFSTPKAIEMASSTHFQTLTVAPLFQRPSTPALLVSDFGPRITIKIVESLREDILSGKLKSGSEIKDALKKSVLDLLTTKGSNTELQLGFRKPAVIMIVGVNGGGKTTSLAGDTFRAAASDQLEIWAERTGCEIVVAEKENAKAASVLSQAVKRGKEEGFDVVLCDTSGRLHTNYSLMEELIACKKAVGKVIRGAPNVVGITGFILTKLDGSTRGGCVVSVVDELGIPVKFVGVGEGPSTV
ncbi:hypothetical protein V6N13_146542 [Hibiscus sabdariffa]